MRDGFSKLHPAVGFVYYAAVIIFSSITMQPVCIAVSLVCALLNAVYLNGKKPALFALRVLLPMAAAVSLINPIVNHQGVTVIEYFPWGNPLTLESILFGLAAASMLCSVALWFSSVNTVITSDKVVYLFGRILPSLSLVLSMSLRFVPRFIEQLRTVRSARSTLNRERSEASLFGRIRESVTVISHVVSWALEGSIETADSMKSRGYGLKGRTAFSLYKFRREDAAVLAIILVLTAALTAGYILGFADFLFYPSLTGELISVRAVSFYALYFLIMIIPLIKGVGEGFKWKRLRSTL